MTTITFHFSKESGSMDLRLLETFQNEVRTEMPLENAKNTSQAVSTIFKMLIAKNGPKYRDTLLKLGPFSVTLLNPTINPSLEIETQELCINIKKLKPDTAALFLKCLPPKSP